jgi:transposase
VVFADRGFARLAAWARQMLGIIEYIGGKLVGQRAFQVRPRRWVAERTLGLLPAHRRPARDYEGRPESVKR